MEILYPSLYGWASRVGGFNPIGSVGLLYYTDGVSTFSDSPELYAFFQAAAVVREARRALLEKMIEADMHSAKVDFFFSDSDSPLFVRTRQVLQDYRQYLLALPPARSGKPVGNEQLVFRRSLRVADGRWQDVEIDYELIEVERDLHFLRAGEESLVQMLQEEQKKNKDYSERQSLELLEKMSARHGKCNFLLTDRDGTINPYCGHYESSVQSLYNGFFVSRTALANGRPCVILTSAPLSPGVIDVCCMPLRTRVLAGSKGREYQDSAGGFGQFPIAAKEQGVLDECNQQLEALLRQKQWQAFLSIGSGMQKKFGQTAVARQDIHKSISPAFSRQFFVEVQRIVRGVDPQNVYLSIEDTGFDIEISLRTSASGVLAKQGEAAVFSKGDGLEFLRQQADLDIPESGGFQLVCGDTAGDFPMFAAAKRILPAALPVLVSNDPDLRAKCISDYPESILVPSPESLLLLLRQLA